ncbi:MAG: hypothetical protein KAS32_19395 [Candidatus Peribacteraceae bacterium]|nr:hypothetical protein [Candidatus Peribacteraceae bacterium]
MDKGLFIYKRAVELVDRLKEMDILIDWKREQWTAISNIDGKIICHGRTLDELNILITGIEWALVDDKETTDGT